LYCWGRNTDGELGLGPGAGIQVRQPARVGSDGNWAHVSAGQGSTCAIKADHTLWCWGMNDAGQLGLGDRTSRDQPARVGDAGWDALSLNTFHACALAGGRLWCWGRNVEGQLGLGDTEDRALPTAVDEAADWSSAGSARFATCAMKTDGSVWCTGANDDGQLGTGDTDRRNTFTRVQALD
jgi:alpha-tubulin suppressor-like RCC1 family protein